MVNSLWPSWTAAHQAPLSMGFSQARKLEGAAISFSRESSGPRDWTSNSRTGRWILYHWPAWWASWLLGLDNFVLPGGCISILASKSLEASTSHHRKSCKPLNHLKLASTGHHKLCKPKNVFRIYQMTVNSKTVPIWELLVSIIFHFNIWFLNNQIKII